jgi:hypothetical protein
MIIGSLISESLTVTFKQIFRHSFQSFPHVVAGRFTTEVDIATINGAVVGATVIPSWALVLFYLVHCLIPQGYHLGWKYNEIGRYGGYAKQTGTRRVPEHSWIKCYLMILKSDVA